MSTRPVKIYDYCYLTLPSYFVGLERLRSILKSLEETSNLSPECLKDGATSIPDISSYLDLEFVAGTSNGKKTLL